MSADTRPVCALRAAAERIAESPFLPLKRKKSLAFGVAKVSFHGETLAIDERLQAVLKGPARQVGRKHSGDFRKGHALGMPPDSVLDRL